MFLCYSSFNTKVIKVYYIVLNNPPKFVSGSLYTLFQLLEVHKTLYLGLYNKLWNLFSIKVSGYLLYSLVVKFLKAIILKTFNEFVLAFFPVESKTNILYVNIHYTGNLFFGFRRYCGKVFLEPAVSHPFWALVLTKNVLSIFFFTLTLSKW